MHYRRIMSHPVTILHTTEKVERVISILRNETHDGFPVVDEYSELVIELLDSLLCLCVFKVYK